MENVKKNVLERLLNKNSKKEFFSFTRIGELMGVNVRKRGKYWQYRVGLAPVDGVRKYLARS